jgi:hypothetical protein
MITRHPTRHHRDNSKWRDTWTRVACRLTDEPVDYWPRYYTPLAAAAVSADEREAKQRSNAVTQ